MSRLPGGTIADVWLVAYADGSRAVAKTATGAPADLFAVEASGLAALHGTGHLATPRVLAVTGRMLLLEALAARDDAEPSWEGFARDLAAVHRGTAGNRFGWHRDG
jgi:fructosamine-3-kinase